MAKYPIVHQPTAEFIKRLRLEHDPEWIITEMKFTQYAESMWGASFAWGAQGKGLVVQMNVGGKEKSLQEIEDRVIKAMRPGGTL